MTAIPGAFSVFAAHKSDAERNKIEFEVQVDDKEVGRQVTGFDGFESAFVMLPRTTPEGVAWERKTLDFAGSNIRSKTGRMIDVHRGMQTGVDLAAISQYGFAVGIETNKGTVWAQNSGGNYTSHSSAVIDLY